MKKRSGEAMAALGRRAPVMRHRLAGRGGSRNDQADLYAELQDADGLEMGYRDSDSLGECCPIGCKHDHGSTCNIPCSCGECLLARMNRPGAREAMLEAFMASGDELSAASVRMLQDKCPKCSFQKSLGPTHLLCCCAGL